MPDYKSKIEYDGKKLPDVFKELKEKQNQDYNNQLISVIKNRNTYKGKLKPKTITVFKIKKKKINFKNLKLNSANNFFIIILLICFAITTFLTNSIAVTQGEINENEKISKVKIEENENSIDIMNILDSNITVIRRKEIVTEQSEINYMTTYRENPNLPKDEQIIAQSGVPGKQELTIVRIYEDNDLVEENIIKTNIYEDAIQEIVDVGSSEFLAKLDIHLGDTVYLQSDAILKESMDNNIISLANIPQYYDVKILETFEEWAKVEYDGQVGFLENSYLTSVALDNEIVNKCRIKKIKSNIDVNMELNKISGLLLEDYQKMLSGISNDKNKIFENNAGVFFEIEQKYNINGVFLASVAIHESGWGTSLIANDKNNLFGYGAYDSSPYQSSFSFDTYGDGIEIVAKSLVKNYLNPAGTIIYNGEIATGTYYNGPNVAGVNIRYASDKNWYMKVFSKMLYLYDRL